MTVFLSCSLGATVEAEPGWQPSDPQPALRPVFISAQCATLFLSFHQQFIVICV